jgi:hypothetical protein
LSDEEDCIIIDDSHSASAQWEERLDEMKLETDISKDSESQNEESPRKKRKRNDSETRKVHEGFLFARDKTAKNGTVYWKCVNKNCKCRAIEKEGKFTLSKHGQSRSHNHPRQGISNLNRYFVKQSTGTV